MYLLLWVRGHTRSQVGIRNMVDLCSPTRVSDPSARKARIWGSPFLPYPTLESHTLNSFHSSLPTYPTHTQLLEPQPLKCIKVSRIRKAALGPSFRM